MIIKVVVVSSKGMPPVGDYSSGRPSKSREVLSSVTLNQIFMHPFIILAIEEIQIEYQLASLNSHRHNPVVTTLPKELYRPSKVTSSQRLQAVTENSQLTCGVDYYPNVKWR